MARADAGGAGGGLPEDVVEDLLAADVRRRALAELADRDGPMDVGDLAAAARARGAESVPAEVSRAERRRLREAFFQDHLPKLTATEVVEYDSLLGTLELGSGPAVDDAIERVRERP